MINKNAVFNLASVSKQFTAACIGILAIQEKLSLEDEITKYLPEFNNHYKTPILIRHLLHHTSGFRDYYDLQFLMGLDEREGHNNSQIIELLLLQKSLNHEPGERFSYNNSGYVLLAEIVHRITGKTLREFAQEVVFQPLGMMNTYFENDYQRIIKNRVLGYSKSKGEYKTLQSTSNVTGDGGLMSTLEDLSKWKLEFVETKLGYEGFIKFLESGKLNNGQSIDYSFGIIQGNYRGFETEEHGGTSDGFRHELIRLPDLNMAVMILSNLEGFPVRELSHKVLDILIEKDETEKAIISKKIIEHPKSFMSVPNQNLIKLTGSYWNKEIGFSRTIELQGNVLIFRVNDNKADTLKAISESKFYTSINNAKRIIEFGIDPISGKKWMTMSINDKIPYKLNYYEPVVANKELLKAYIGTFYSDELKAVYVLKVEGLSLSLYCNHKKIAQVVPVYKDYFRKIGGRIRTEFFSNNNGQIQGFMLSSWRANEIKFLKIE